MHKEMNSTQDIFNLNLITSDDIGENNYTNIINQLDNIINLIEDILFELDNKGRCYEWKEKIGTK